MECLLELKIAAYYKYVQIIKNATDKVMEFFGADEEERYTIKLAIAEATANIIKHSYNGEKNKEIKFYINKNKIKKEFEFILIDYGQKVECEKIKSRSLNQVEESGLGVFLIQSIMESVKYEHMNNGTKLIMKKKIGDDTNDKPK